MKTATVLPAAGEPDMIAIIRTYNDVTERLKHSHELLRREICRLRDELHEKNKELQRRERLAALGEMAAGVAHEIRNPLGGIGLYASLLERDLKDRPDERDIARRIGVGVRNMEGILGDILVFAGDAEPRRRRVLLSDIVDAVVTQTVPQSERSNCALELDVVGHDAVLNCDPSQIERALINLVLNALDAAGTGGTVRIGCHLEDRDADIARIVVEDTGPGIAPVLAHRIFNPFFTTKDTGTGLGLAIVHRIAESHGGSVTAENRPGGGARFVLTVPRWEESTVASADVVHQIAGAA